MIAVSDGTGSVLTGAGSTFDFPFLSRAFYDYDRQHHIEVNYQPIGSGGGVLQLMQGTVSFGATDVPMSRSEKSLAEARGGPFIELPVTLGADAISYNLPGLHTKLTFTPAILAGIFLGRITNWDDPMIRAVNRHARIPHLTIVVVHRADSSGTTYIFTDYLSRVSLAWRKQVGTGEEVEWPVGVGAKGNTAVAQTIEATPGAIGYVELAYVRTSHMAYGLVENADHHFVIPDPATIMAAAQTLSRLSQTDFSIVNARGAYSYPISGFSWVVLYAHQKHQWQASVLRQMLTWLITTEQRQAYTVGNAPLPLQAQAYAVRQLAALGDRDKPER